MLESLLFISGLLLGAGIAYIVLMRGGNTATSENIKLKAQLEAEQNNIDRFENLAGKVLASQSDKSRVELEKTLSPLKQNLDNFRNRLEDLQRQRSKESSALTKHIEILQQSNSALSQQAENLTNALRSDKKMQGDWGEVILEKILQQSGLEEGREYETQSSFKDSEGKRFQPDVILKLPDDKNIIIDSKVSLNAYTDYCNEEDEQQQRIYLKQHIQAIDNHIVQLGSKNYENLKGLHSLDYILMFFPLEAAFLAAQKEDPQLFERGISKHIILVTPSTLLATLKVIHNIWRNEKRALNAQEIALEGGRLYDKFHGFVEDIQGVDKSLRQAQQNLDGAKNKLYEGRGNMISRAEKMKELGANTKKQLPENL